MLKDESALLVTIVVGVIYIGVIIFTGLVWVFTSFLEHFYIKNILLDSEYENLEFSHHRVHMLLS